jgi:WD40 repeat protein
VNGWAVVLVLLVASGAPRFVSSLLRFSSPRPPITALAFAPDGKSVLVGSQAGLEVRSWPALEKLRSLPTALAHVHDLAFSPDGKALAAVGGAPARRGTVELYSWPEGKLLRRASPSKDLLLAAAWRADSRALLTAGADSVARTLDPVTLKETKSFEGHSRGVLAAAYLPGGAELVTAGLDESLRVWDADAGTLLRTLSNHTRPVLGLSVRPGDEKPPMIASAGEDRTLRLWQPTVGRLVRFARLKSVPLAVAWSGDGKALLAACKDGRLRVLDPDTMDVLRELAVIDGVAHSLAVGPDGSALVGGQGGQLRPVVRKAME